MMRILEEALVEELIRCTHCGTCRSYCPVFNVVKKESWGARGRIFIIEALQEGMLEIDSGVLDRIYSCTLCKACEEICESLVKYSDIMMDVREKLAMKELGPLQEYRDMALNILKTGNVLGRRTRLVDACPLVEKLPDRSENLLYLGCVVSSSYPEKAEAMVKILQKAGYSFTVLKNGENCCGAFLELVGLKEESREALGKAAADFSDADVESIVTMCPFCYGTFHENLKEFAVRHSSELLEELIERGKIRPEKRLEATVAFFDPCHLGRWHGMYNQPRKVVESIPGVKLVEMERTRETSRCCGGPIRAAFPRVRAEMSSKILEEAKEKKAKYVVTACPTCYHNLKIPSIKHKIRVVTIEELIAYSAGIIGKP